MFWEFELHRIQSEPQTNHSDLKWVY